MTKNLRSLRKNISNGNWNQIFNRKPDNTRKYLMIAGVIVGSIALLSYPAMLLYRRFKNRNQESEQSQTKSFAPSYRGSHKPHHRKAEANGHLSK